MQGISIQPVQCTLGDQQATVQGSSLHHLCLPFTASKTRQWPRPYCHCIQTLYVQGYCACLFTILVRTRLLCMIPCSANTLLLRSSMLLCLTARHGRVRLHSPWGCLPILCCPCSWLGQPFVVEPALSQRCQPWLLLPALLLIPSHQRCTK